MAGNQEDFLSDRDLVALAKEWLGSLVGAGQPEVDPATGLPPVSIPPPQYSMDPRFQTQIGADPEPRFIGGPGILEHAATGPIGGLKSVGSLLRLLLKGKGPSKTPSLEDIRRFAMKDNLREIQRLEAQLEKSASPEWIQDAKNVWRRVTFNEPR